MKVTGIGLMLGNVVNVGAAADTANWPWALLFYGLGLLGAWVYFRSE